MCDKKRQISGQMNSNSTYSQKLHTMQDRLPRTVSSGAVASLPYDLELSFTLEELPVRLCFSLPEKE